MAHSTTSARTTHKAASACLRLFELGCCAIILGILARFFHVLNRINGPTDSRLVYAISIAAISVALSFLLLAPVKFSFHFFPVDFALFVCWIVCFALLEDLTGTNTCTSRWFRSYWTVYWNSETDTRTVITRRGCSQWRTVIAFSFIVSMAWLLSGCLGGYVCMQYYELDKRITRMARNVTWWKKPKQQDPEKSAADSHGEQLIPKAGPASPTVSQT